MILIGIPACAREIGGRLQHATPARYAEALIGGSGAIPVGIPPLAEAMMPVLDRLDGLLVPGSPSNVEPHHYGSEESATPDRHDPLRDATVLPMIREALRRGMPVLAICRGNQELNVALGGTLHQQVHDVAGRTDHRGRGETLDEHYGPRHAIVVEGRLAAMLGRTTTRVNSVHEQAIDRPGARAGGGGAGGGRDDRGGAGGGGGVCVRAAVAPGVEVFAARGQRCHLRRVRRRLPCLCHP